MSYPRDIDEEAERTCWLCGLSIFPCVGEERPITRYGAWLRRCRLITFSNDPAPLGGRAHVSGIGYREAPVGPAYWVPREPAAATEPTPDQPPEADMMVVTSPPYSRRTGIWTFRVHAACWDIAETRAGNDSAWATTWAKLLATLGWDYGADCPVYMDEGMIANTLLNFLQKQGGPVYSVRINMSHINRMIGMDGPERLKRADELLDALRREILPEVAGRIGLEDLGLHLGGQDSLAENESGDDIFQMLPMEIIHLVLSMLPTPTVLSLRLASRAAAYKSRLELLPQAFWRSRFQPEFELGFALPVDYEREEDWRILYFLVRKGVGREPPSHFEEGVALRLARRQVLWSRLSVVVQHCERFMSWPQLQGIPFSWNSLGDTRDFTINAASWGGVTPSVTYHPGRALDFHGQDQSRFPRRFSLESSQKSLTRLVVSTSLVGAWNFITGLQATFTDTQDGRTSVESVGYVRHDDSTAITLDPSETVSAVHVFTHQYAIAALRLTIYNKLTDKSRKSPWIGHKVDPEVRASVSCLSRVSTRHPFVLGAEFDSFRMLNIGFLEHSDALEATDTSTR